MKKYLVLLGWMFLFVREPGITEVSHEYPDKASCVQAGKLMDPVHYWTSADWDKYAKITGQTGPNYEWHHWPGTCEGCGYARALVGPASDGGQVTKDCFHVPSHRM